MISGLKYCKSFLLKSGEEADKRFKATRTGVLDLLYFYSKTSNAATIFSASSGFVTSIPWYYKASSK